MEKLANFWWSFSLLWNLSHEDFEKTRVQYDWELDFNLPQFIKSALKYILRENFHYLYMLLGKRYAQKYCKTTVQYCLNVFNGYSENITLPCLYLLLADFFLFFFFSNLSRLINRKCKRKDLLFLEIGSFQALLYLNDCIFNKQWLH